MVGQRFRAKPGKQITAPLPRDRIVESPLFEVTRILSGTESIYWSYDQLIIVLRATYGTEDRRFSTDQ